MPDSNVAVRGDGSNWEESCLKMSVWPTSRYIHEPRCVHCVRPCAQWGGRNACIGCRADSVCRQCCVKIGELVKEEREAVDIPIAYDDFFVCISCLWTRMDTESPAPISPPVGTTSLVRSSTHVSASNNDNLDEDLQAALAASLADLAPIRRSQISSVGVTTPPGPSPGKMPAPSPRTPSPGKMPPTSPPSPASIGNVRRPPRQPSAYDVSSSRRSPRKMAAPPSVGKQMPAGDTSQEASMPPPPPSLRRSSSKKIRAPQTSFPMQACYLPNLTALSVSSSVEAGAGVAAPAAAAVVAESTSSSGATRASLAKLSPARASKGDGRGTMRQAGVVVVDNALSVASGDGQGGPVAMAAVAAAAAAIASSKGAEAGSIAPGSNKFEGCSLGGQGASVAHVDKSATTVRVGSSLCQCPAESVAVFAVAERVDGRGPQAAAAGDLEDQPVDDNREEATQKAGVSWPRRFFRWVCVAVAAVVGAVRTVVWNRRR